MIHGIYVKSKTNSKWHLVSKAVSAEMASQDVIALKLQLIKDGKVEADVAIQTFDSDFYIPQIISHIKPQKLLFN